ncbi:hypothetical protein G6F65_022067 [Rhizopus arrhizus]|nr:hypothetical protein G6F65_022067 [Rhizopus arrhizus]
MRWASSCGPSARCARAHPDARRLAAHAGRPVLRRLPDGGARRARGLGPARSAFQCRQALPQATGYHWRRTQPQAFRPACRVLSAFIIHGVSKTSFPSHADRHRRQAPARRNRRGARAAR